MPFTKAVSVLESKIRTLQFRQNEKTIKQSKKQGIYLWR